MENPRVTVVLPIFREPVEVIRRAADSIFGQTYKNLRAYIVLDDPTNQEAIAFLDEYCSGRSSFAYSVNEKNLGLTASLNNAIAVVADNADLICRMDADDVSHKERIERQVSFLLENNLDLVGCFMNTVDEEGSFLYQVTGLPVSPSGVTKALRYNNCVMHPTWLGRASVLARGYRPVPQSEDYDFLLRLALDGFKIGNCPEVLLDYTFSKGSISRSNLLRQYLYQCLLTKAYRAGKALNLEEAESFVGASWTEARNARYSAAHNRVNGFLGAKGAGKVTQALPLVLSLICSPEYVDKAWRLARAAIIARLDRVS